MNEVEPNLREKYRPAKIEAVWKQILWEEAFFKEDIHSGKIYRLLYKRLSKQCEAIRQTIGESVQIEELIGIQLTRYYAKSLHEERGYLLKESLLKNGQRMPIILNWDESRLGYVIVDGFHRLEAMRELGFKTVIVQKLKVTPETEQYIHHTLNIPISELPPEIIELYLIEMVKSSIDEIKEKNKISEEKPPTDPKTHNTRIMANATRAEKKIFSEGLEQAKKILGVNTNYEALEAILIFFLNKHNKQIYGNN